MEMKLKKKKKKLKKKYVESVILKMTQKKIL